MGKGNKRATRLVTTGVLALASGGAMTAALLASGVGPASASTATATYSCNLSGITTISVPVSVSATAPSSVSAGGAVSLSDVTVSATLPAATITELISVLGASTKSIGGTITEIDLGVSGGSPSSINAAASPLTFSVPVKKGSPATLSVSPGTVGGITAGSSGNVTITPGNIIIKATVKSLGNLTVTCTAPSSAPTLVSIAVASSSSAPTTTSATTTPVPTTHTGEPWAGWPYWVLVGMLGLGGLATLERAVRIRRQKA